MLFFCRYTIARRRFIAAFPANAVPLPDMENQAKNISEHLARRILVLDGATGTLIQTLGLQQKDFVFQGRGPMRGLNDLLCLTRPDSVEDIHRRYLEAGADIISTNTFNANEISLEEYAAADLSDAINAAAVALARRAADAYATPERPRWVAGILGPTGRTASLSPDVADPSVRNITFDRLFEAYSRQARTLAEGGADLLMVETVFDSLNAKAAVAAAHAVCSLPVMLSGTVTDASGRLLSGQTIEAFYASFARMGLFSIGLNCALGAEQMLPFLERLSRTAALPVSCHPNAGLPDGFGGYAQTMGQMAAWVEKYLQEGLVNIVGGCCGTTPEYISLLSEMAGKYSPRRVPEADHRTVLAGLEPLVIEPEANFVNVGERANVAGSARFARLVREEKWDEAVEIVRKQVEDGAQIIDVCMDAPMIDAREAMTHFLRLLAGEPDIARVPLMLDSSSWDVLTEAMKAVQGKHIVNSVSLKEGEDTFLAHLRTIRSMGCAAVLMLFDERGQADTFQRKMEVARRMYRLATGDGFAPEDIIFDPNILAVATGMKEHDRYAADFIQAVRQIKQEFPRVKVSGGVSNLSFSFRGNNTVREAMHSVFLYHATRAGMDMGIVNAGMLRVYSDIEPELLVRVEDVVLARRDDASERLIQYAESLQQTAGDPGRGKTPEVSLEELYPDVCKRLEYKIVKGLPEGADADALEALRLLGTPVEVIDRVLMKGMETVGELFGQGKMFLPQVVKSARVMKRAVDAVTPFMEKKDTDRGKRMLIATVKGDVHDIGKNIVSVVMACNGYQVTDLGVMVPPEEIVCQTRRTRADLIGLSGLITPSLEEMAATVRALDQAGIDVPVIVGGATTSELHTAVKIAPLYRGTVARAKDASHTVRLAAELLSGAEKAVRASQESLREEYFRKNEQRAPLVPLELARQRAPKYDFAPAPPPLRQGVIRLEDYPLEKLRERIDWREYLAEWGIRGRYPELLSDPEKGREARKVLDEGRAVLEDILAHKALTARGVAGIFPASAQGDDIVLEDGRRYPQLRNQTASFKCLSDFLSPQGDFVGAFAVTAGIGLQEYLAHTRDDYQALTAKILANRLAEAFSQEVFEQMKTSWWGFRQGGIRPACGYPTLPDHSGKRILFDWLDAEAVTGIRLTENYMMQPEASVSGLIFARKEAHYFDVGRLGEDQLEDYARRRGLPLEAVKKYTGHA